MPGLRDILDAATPRCHARRVHPISSDYYVRCEKNNGHEGQHHNDGWDWTDDSLYSLPPLQARAGADERQANKHGG